MAAPTEAQAARVKQAIIAKAIRFLLMPGNPYGVFGISGDVDGAMATIRPDYAINEFLFGLRAVEDFDISSVTVTVDEVVASMDGVADDFSTEKKDAIERAIDGAKDWVAEFLAGGWGLA